MPRTWDNADAICPFFETSGIKMVTCEGITDDNRLCILFADLLKVLYILRFDEDYRFKGRLNKFLAKFSETHEYINELSKDRVLASVFIKEIEKSGVDLGGIFDDLIEFEEVEYELDKDKNFGKRCAGK